MPRKPSPPTYKLHKSSGQARVTLNGRHYYLGQYGSPESREKYARLIAEYYSAAGNRSDLTQRQSLSIPKIPTISVNEVILKYVLFARTYYRKDGEPSREIANIQDATKPLQELFGLTVANDFGPRSLKLVQEHLVRQGKLSRGVLRV